MRFNRKKNIYEFKENKPISDVPFINEPSAGRCEWVIVIVDSYGQYY